MKSKIKIYILLCFASALAGCGANVPSKEWIEKHFQYYVEGTGDNNIGQVIGGLNSSGSEVEGSVFSPIIDQAVGGTWISRGVARVVDGDGNTYTLTVRN